MNAATAIEPGAGGRETKVERASDRELVVTRDFAAPPRLVWAAWTTPALLQKWWAPKSFGVAFVSCEADVRTGGSYRFVMRHPGSDQPMAFFGRYLEATPPRRLMWTNEEAGEDGPVTSVTFEDHEGGTRLVLRDLYPTKAALDAAIASQATSGFGEMFGQLDTFLATEEAR